MKGPLNYCFEIFVYLKLVLRFCLLYLALNIFYFNIVKNLFNYVQLDIFLCLPTNPCLPTFLSSYLPVLNQPMSSYQPILTFLSLPSTYFCLPSYQCLSSVNQGVDQIKQEKHFVPHFDKSNLTLIEVPVTLRSKFPVGSFFRFGLSALLPQQIGVVWPG